MLLIKSVSLLRSVCFGKHDYPAYKKLWLLVGDLISGTEEAKVSTEMQRFTKLFGRIDDQSTLSCCTLTSLWRVVWPGDALNCIC